MTTILYFILWNILHMIADITTFDNILYWSKSITTHIYVSGKAATSSGHSNY